MLAEDMVRFYADPLGYVMYAFPWGQEGTILSDQHGPKTWQRDVLVQLGEEIKQRAFDGLTPVLPIRFATSSGHDIGKSALSAWLTHFIMDTRPYSKGTVTANTAPQLRTKTWAEVGKWHNLSITKDLKTYHNTQGNMCMYNNDHKDEWRVDAYTCKEENSESFAGQHTNISTPWYLFDEASAVPNPIWEVAEGGLTDGEPMMFVWGNPTQPTGKFRECFGRQAHRWNTRQIDSRTVEGCKESKLFEQWVQDYGEDSDFVRVRVRGVFPNAGAKQLIPQDLVRSAMGKKLDKTKFLHAPRVLGVDVAWEGDDRSAIFMRQGLMSWLVWQGREVDGPTIATIVGQLEDKYAIDATFVDVGWGTSVIDSLRMQGRSPIVVHFGGKSSKPLYANKRAQMWGEMGEWLKEGGCLPDDVMLEADLISVQYEPHKHSGCIILEPKASMKKRGLSSPDLADALALTFAQPVRPKDPLAAGRKNHNTNRVESHFSIF